MKKKENSVKDLEAIVVNDADKKTRRIRNFGIRIPLYSRTSSSGRKPNISHPGRSKSASAISPKKQSLKTQRKNWTQQK